MPWSAKNPPRPATNWSVPAKALCARVANAVLKQSGKEDQAIYACIRAVKLKYPSQIGSTKKNDYEVDITKFDFSELDNLSHEELRSLARQGVFEVEFEPWSTKQKNTLPDSAYAIVYKRPDGVKIRALPHHTSSGAVDKSHVQNALARWNQVKGVPPGVKAAGKVHLEAHARKLGMGDRKAASEFFADAYDITNITFEQEGEGESERHVTKGMTLAVSGKFVHPIWGEIDLSDQVLNEMKRNHDRNVLKTDVAIDERHDRGRALGWVKQGSLKRTKVSLHGKDYSALLGDISWTSAGRHLLEEKIYKYFSPEYGTYIEPDGKTKHENVLVGGALTNRPFLKMMPAIKFDEGQATNVMVLDEGTDDDELWELENDTEEVIAFSVGFRAFDIDNEDDKDDEDDMAVAELIAKAKALGLEVTDEGSLEKALEQMTSLAKGDKEVRSKLKEAGIEFSDETPTHQVVAGAVTTFASAIQNLNKVVENIQTKSLDDEAKGAATELRRAGKIQPNQLEEYVRLYKTDKSLFDSLTKTLVPIIQFSEIGGPGVLPEPGEGGTDSREFADPEKAQERATKYLEETAGLAPKSKTQPTRFDPNNWRNGRHVSESGRR